EILSRLPGVSFAKFGQPSFVDPKNVKEEEKEEARRALAEAHRAMLSGRYDLIVLDEVNVAAAWKLISVEEVLHLIRDKPEEVELILTGRYAPAELVEAADLVTEMMEVKHPFQKGVMARPGIDY
ncbi:MAG: cobinamide adenolsyltransferase, partial [Chloroflexi bacterium RBG_13_54_9]